MRVLSTATLKALFLPGGFWFLGAVTLVHFGGSALALSTLGFFYYCAIAGGMLLAWRFHSSRVFLCLSVVFLAQQAAVISAGQPPYIPTTLDALAVLVPVNFVLIALIEERGFNLKSLAPVALFLLAQCLTVAVFCGAALRVPSLSGPIVLPRYAIAVSAFVAVFFCVRFLANRKPIDAALLWSLGAVFLALRAALVARESTLFWAASACILASAVIENSYLLAYHDELTTLPSRRAFTEAIQRLKPPYSIAVVDIDHFKRCNDTYGHETGDEVLRLVAAHLGRVTAGGQAYRCGGEEFSILFPGKTTTEVLPHLEKLRETVQNSEFRLRGGMDRRQLPRGPDRRNRPHRGPSRGASLTRRRAEQKLITTLSVTISIGVSTGRSEQAKPAARAGVGGSSPLPGESQRAKPGRDLRRSIRAHARKSRGNRVSRCGIGG